MLNDPCAPRHAAGLFETVAYMADYAHELGEMYDSGEPLDIQRADQLVNAIRALYPALLDDLYFLDDVQQMSDMSRTLDDTPAHEIVGTTCRGFAPLGYLEAPPADAE